MLELVKVPEKCGTVALYAACASRWRRFHDYCFIVPDVPVLAAYLQLGKMDWKYKTEPQPGNLQYSLD
jgi:hypothetical protein